MKAFLRGKSFPRGGILARNLRGLESADNAFASSTARSTNFTTTISVSSSRHACMPRLRGAKTAAAKKPKVEVEVEAEAEAAMEESTAIDGNASKSKPKNVTKAAPKQEKAKKEAKTEGKNEDSQKAKGYKPYPTFPKHASAAFDSMKMPHCIFIDNSFLVHRAYHSVGALGLKSTKGQALGAVFGYTRAMLKLFSDMKGEYVAVFCDAGKSFRQEIYPEYKAQRLKTPSDLKQQFAIVDEAVKALGLESLKIQGMEADDLIATYTRKAQAAGCKVTIVSRDKDLMQLVCPTVRLYDPVGQAMIDEKAVQEKFFVPPSKLGYVLALVGDASDNIPGVPKIGPKTAADLIEEFNDLDNLIENAHTIKSKAHREAIIAHANDIALAHKLITLRENIDVSWPLKSFAFKPIEREKILPFLEKHEFNSIIENLDYICPLPKKEGAGGQQHQHQHKEPTKKRPGPLPPMKQPKDKKATNGKTAEETGEDTGPRAKRPEVVVPGVTIVDTKEKAEEVVKMLMSPEIRDRYHACDTEAAYFDIKKDSPYANGRVICASIFCGSDVNFGNGPRIWIDNLDDADGVLNVFAPYFEDKTIKKVFHNFSFDRALLHNHSIDVQGLGADTIHMARLWDAARTHKGGYSLEALTSELLEGRSKRSIKTIFGKAKTRRDGTPGKEMVIPELEDLQRGIEGEEALKNWIDYSTFDTEGTYLLREALEEELRKMPWVYDRPESPEGWDNDGKTMWDYYKEYWLPFGELLSAIEKRGIKIDVDHLKAIEKVAWKETADAELVFKKWAEMYCEGAYFMNIASDAQKQQFFFAPTKNKFTDEPMPDERVFETENTHGFVEYGKNGEPKKKRSFTIAGLGIPPIDYTQSGWPAVSADVLKKLAGRPFENTPKYGTAYSFFKGGEDGREACEAIDSLIKSETISTLLSNFIVPLQTQVDSSSRIHASLNLNTETGRLSCRKPNLQNQPALDKDRYKIRAAFSCEKGNSLIVADYGQLELRVLAHMTRCRSMIDAFEKGGDFHSRTAMGMYPEVAQAVDDNEVLLEWDYSVAPTPPKPLLKDVYANQRKNAKTLNFSIAYGKTAMGLSRDWGVTKEEAEETLERWYADRPEVKQWQENTIESAKQLGYTQTLMGRRRPLPEINDERKGISGHAERAAINTPIQGGAADIVIHAMIKTHRDEKLNKMGWHMVLQVHDELMLEGPEDTAEEALARLIEIMQNPLPEPLLVDLLVDGDVGKNWFESK